MSLISSPAKAWEEIRLEEDRRKVFVAFVYPMIGLCGLAVFIGSLLADGWGGPQTQQFAGYALVVSFLLKIITGLLPDFSIIGWLLQFYIVYVVWEGAPIVMQVEEKNRLRFTILSSLLLILCPAVIQFVFNKLTAILN